MKKIIAMLLLSAFLVSSIGCGSESAKSGTSTPPKSGTGDKKDEKKP